MSEYQSVNLSIVYLSIYLSICPSVYLSIYLTIYLSFFIFMYLSFYLSIYVSFYLSGIRLSNNLSIISTFLSDSPHNPMMFTPITSSIYICICLSTHTKPLSSSPFQCLLIMTTLCRKILNFSGWLHSLHLIQLQLSFYATFLDLPIALHLLSLGSLSVSLPPLACCCSSDPLRKLPLRMPRAFPSEYHRSHKLN